MSEYILEVESFPSVDAAKKWALKNIKVPKGDNPIVNIVSRDIEVKEA